MGDKGDWIAQLLGGDFMPHGPCWGWDPWAVGSNVLGDSLIALSYFTISLCLAWLRFKRREARFNPFLDLFACFIFACGCTHFMDVYNTWHGQFRLAGTLKVGTALISFAAMVHLLRAAPGLVRLPTLGNAEALGEALTFETRAKQRMAGQLKETEDRFRVLVDSINDYAIVMLDPGGHITSWNPGAKRITGYAEAEVLGRSHALFFDPVEVAEGKPEALLRTAAAKGRIEDEGWRVRRDGQRYVANLVITAFHNGDGGLQGFATVARDITQQKADQDALEQLADNLEDQVKAQVRELRESEARLQGFIRHAPAAIAFKGLDGRYLLINPRMACRIGRPAVDILDRRYEEIHPEDASGRVQARDQEVLILRQGLQEEECWLREDGTSQHYLTQRFPLVDGTGQCWGLGIISTDITDRKLAEQALLQRQKLESLGVLAGGIAHDFNNLLGAMQGNVELAMGEPDLGGALPHLVVLKTLMGKASELLRQMLAYSGQGKTAPRTLDLNQLVEEMTHLLVTSVSKKAALRLELHPQPLPVLADPSQLQQVVMNLVINASEAMGEQHGLIQVRTGLEWLGPGSLDSGCEGEPLAPGAHALLEVLDNGAGMAPEVQKRIFDPFFTTKFAGRGLGLASMHGIVRSHRGCIQVRSQAGQGSSFRVLLPLASGPLTGDPEALAPVSMASTKGGERGLVLVVDDEDPMRAVVVKTLQRRGFVVLEAVDGLEALNRYEANRDQLRMILMDLTMPNLDGQEACRELRRRGAKLPIILSSGFSESEAVGRFQGLGLAGFLQKPFALATLVELVEQVLPGEG